MMPDRVALSPSDDELLARLADALMAPLLQPTEAGLAALRAAVDARTTWPAGTPAGTIRERWWGWTGRSRRSLVALGLIGGVCVGGTGAAFAGGASLPEPVRAVAHQLGLPVGAPSPGWTRHTDSSRRPERASRAIAPTRAAVRARRARASGRAVARSGHLDASVDPQMDSAPLQSTTPARNPVPGPVPLPTAAPYARQGRRQTSTPATKTLCQSDCRSELPQLTGSAFGSSTRSPSVGYPTAYPSSPPSSPGPGGRTAQTTDGD